jgi:hypothetical protein
LDLFARYASLTLEGLLGFDTLFQFSPFRFSTEAGANLALRQNNKLLMAVQVALAITGPTPWHFRGSATFSVFGFKRSVDIEYRTGPTVPPPLPEPVDVVKQLCKALRDTRNWTGELPEHERPLVTLREVSRQGALLVHPLAALNVRQRVVPINRLISKFGNTRPAGGKDTFRIEPFIQGNKPVNLQHTALQDYFARAQFEELRDDEKLTQASFEQMDAGLRFEPRPDQTGFDATRIVQSRVEYDEQWLTA